MTYYNRKDITVNGATPDTIKSCSPCAYCEVSGLHCRCCKDYSEFIGAESVLIKKEQVIL